MADDLLPPRTTGGHWRWEPPSPEELQEVMPGYRIEKLLGRGGMGAVFRGVQINLDRPVAIKILPPGVEQEDPSFAERFKNEARLMARLNHPGVVTVYDFGANGAGQLYFVMEYVDGSDVAEMIQAQGRLSAEHALAITAHVCDALSAAHELGIVHRDIKPANVLINMKGQVKVADFGLAKVEDPGQHGITRTGYAMGTPDFAAPEALVLGKNIDGRADLYAVGVMLYQMLTGNIPRGAYKPASMLIPGVDSRFDPIINKAMQHDREERFQTSSDLRRDLDVILTVPLVREGAPNTSAIPMTDMISMPMQRTGVPKAGGRGKGTASGNSPWSDRSQEAPAKSKGPLLVGLSVAAVLGVGVMVWLKNGGGEATQTDGSAAASSSERQQAKGASPSGASQAYPVGQWVKVFRSTAEVYQAFSRATVKDGWITLPELGNAFLMPDSLTKNYAIRATFRHEQGEPNSLVLRRYQFEHSVQIKWTPKLAFIQQREGAKFTMLAREVIKDAPPSGTEYRMQLAAVGSKFVGRYGAKGFLYAKDSSCPEGTAGIYGLNPFRDVEVMNLDGLTEAEALHLLNVDPGGEDKLSRDSTAVAATPIGPAGQWVPAFKKGADLPSNLYPPGSSITWKDGTVSSSKPSNLFLSHPFVNYKNGGWRAKISASSDFEMRLRDLVGTRAAFYGLHRRNLTYAEKKNDKLESFTLAQISAPEPASPDQFQLWEVAAVGSRIIARCDGRLICSVVDDRVQEGKSLLVNFTGEARDIETIALDGLSEAEALRILGVDAMGQDLGTTSLAQEQVPDKRLSVRQLAVLNEQFFNLHAERVVAPFEADVAKLDVGYVGGLELEIAKEKAAGNLDGVLALEEEKKRVASGVDLPADDTGAMESLRGLRTIYRDEYRKIVEVRAANLRALTDPLIVRLRQLESDLTVRDRIEDAKLVRDYRENLKEPLPLPAEN